MKKSLSGKQFSFGTFGFWKSYLIHMRPYLFFVSGLAGLSGIALSDISGFPVWKTIILFIPFFLGYGFGQALTDCFQIDTDKISSPYRPMSQGIVSVKSVLLTSIVGLTFIGSMLFLFHIYSFLFSLLAVFGLATYSYVKKNIWFGGPFYNAWIMALLPVMGYFASAGNVVKIFPENHYHLILITFFCYANFVLIGYLKDIDADRETGYKTFPVVFGWTKTMMVGDVFGIIALTIFWNSGVDTMASYIFGIVGSIIFIIGQTLGHISKHKNEKEAMIPIISTVRTFILIHSALVLQQKPEWVIQMLILYILFEIVLYYRPSKYQI